MRRFDVKNEDKEPSHANKRGGEIGSGNTIQKEAFDGMSKALNVLKVKFDCGEGNKGGRFSESL